MPLAKSRLFKTSTLKKNPGSGGTPLSLKNAIIQIILLRAWGRPILREFSLFLPSPAIIGARDIPYNTNAIFQDQSLGVSK